MVSRNPPPGDRRDPERSRLNAPRNALYTILRFIGRHVRGFWTALAAFLTAGLALGCVAAVAFGVLAGIVQGGTTQALDERVVRWFAAHRSPALDDIMMEATTLGDGVVLIMIVAVASVFLWLTKHRWSVYILLVGMIGGKLLNTLLKASFDRTRPSAVEWIDQVSSPSFPSGHAMGAFITYGTVAYLVARLEPTRRLRYATWFITCAIIVVIGVSRMYLGVHYPSDVIAGFAAGLAWVAFVASSVAAVRFFAPRRPATAVEERDLTTHHEHAPVTSGADSPADADETSRVG